jgi:hypothetical protein
MFLFSLRICIFATGNGLVKTHIENKLDLNKSVVKTDLFNRLITCKEHVNKK